MPRLPPFLTRLPRTLPAALWLAALAVAVVLMPVLIPGDGLVWSPGPKGIGIQRIAQHREVTFAEGQRIVYFNGTSWDASMMLHQRTPFFPLQSRRISYEIRDGEWKLRRQVLQATLPFSVALDAYWRPAALLLLLAVLALVLPRAGLPALGSAVAVWTIPNQNLTLFALFQLRHLELTALLLAFGLGELLRRFSGPGGRFVNALPWIAVTAVALSWVVATDRWQWWQGVLWALAALGALTVAAGVIHFTPRRTRG